MKKTFLILNSAILSTAYFLANPLSVLAQDEINLGPQGDFNALGNITPRSLVSGAIRFILVVAAVLFFFMLVIGGVQWIVSGGDKAGSENARKKITSALVGLAIVFAAWAIAALIGTLFGVNIFNLAIPTLTNSS